MSHQSTLFRRARVMVNDGAAGKRLKRGTRIPRSTDSAMHRQCYALLMNPNDAASAIPASPATWHDLSQEIAVIANAPAYFYPQGGHRDAEGNWIEAPDDTAEKFEPFAAEFLRMVSEDLRLRGEPLRTASPKLDRYHPGKYGTGGPYETVAILISLFPVANQAVQALTAWLQLGEYALELKRGWRRLFERVGIPLGEGDALIFSASNIEAACLHHAYVHYAQPGDPIVIETVCRPVGGGSPAHPTGQERYTTQVHLGATTYIYVADGYLNPLEHLMVSLGSITPLELPDFGPYRATPVPDTETVRPFPLSPKTLR